jgi:hypothetical protein
VKLVKNDVIDQKKAVSRVLHFILNKRVENCLLDFGFTAVHLLGVLADLYYTMLDL